MKIELQYLSAVYDDNQIAITDASILKKLNGVIENAELSQYLESDFEDIGFSGGSIQLSFDGANLYSTVSYYSERLLNDEELNSLKEETNGQMLDGYGEVPLNLLLSGQHVIIELADALADELPLSINQIDDGSKPKKPRRSPIFSAIEKGDIEKARKYLTPEHLFSLDKWEFTPLMLAIRERHTDLAIDIIKTGANVHHVAKCSGSTPLRICAMAGDVEVCKQLINLGVDINRPDVDPDGIHSGYTALFWSANRGHVELTKYLIESGADVNFKSECGDTAIKLAQDSNIVDILLKYGANSKNA